MSDKLDNISTTDLLNRHRELHSLMFKSAAPSDGPDQRDLYRTEHFTVFEEMIRRGVYHPMISPMDFDALEELDYELTKSYFELIGDIVGTSEDVVQIELSYPNIADTAMYVTDMLIEKYSPQQPRDDFGKWVPYGQAGIGGAGAFDPDDPDRAKVRVWNADQQRMESLQNNLFGKQLSSKLVSNLMGNPIGGTVTLKANGANSLHLRTVNKPLVRKHEGTFKKGPGGLSFHQTLTPRINLPDKTTADIVAKQVPALKQVGVKRFTAEAGKDYDRHHDYINLARAGFTAPIPPKLKSLLQESTFEDVKGAKTIADLMQTDNGAKWWKAHGTGFTGEFDLNPGSVSMKLLRRFLSDGGDL